MRERKPGRPHEAREARAKLDAKAARRRTRPEPEIRTWLSSAAFYEAIRGSHGIRATICRRAMITRAYFDFLLAKPGHRWDRCRKLYTDECRRIDDLARDTIRQCMSQRDHLPTALKAAEFHLQRRVREEYGDQRTVVLEGGDRPIKTDGRTEVSMDLISKLPIEARKALLAAIDESNRPSADVEGGAVPRRDEAERMAEKDAARLERRKARRK